MVPAAHDSAPVDSRWNLDAIYPGVASPQFVDDVRAAYRDVLEAGALAERCSALAPGLDLAPSEVSLCTEMSLRCTRARDLLADLHVYCTALVSIGEHSDATQVALKRISAMSGQLSVHEQRFADWLATWPDEQFQRWCGEHTTPEAVTHWRLTREQVCLRPADKTIMLLAPEASRAWSALYERLVRELVVTILAPPEPPQRLNITQAIVLLTGPEAEQRQRAWHAIRAAWAPHETTVAAILNSLAGHRIKVQQIGGASGDVRAPSLKENRLQAPTLDALMEAVHNRRLELRMALRIMSRLLGKERLDPWDLAAPYAEPGTVISPMSLREGLSHVHAAFEQVSPAMGEFVERMRLNRWIDARPGDSSRRLGAYQTSLRRGRHPLVFVNYQGRWSDLVTLAHELGHAFHFWTLRELPAHTHHLPISLAECASSFAEMQIRRSRAKLSNPTIGSCRSGVWDECQAAAAFLLNIGASYTFEYSLYLNRHKREMSAPEISESLRQSWEDWFGGDIGAHDDKGWVRKPHFAGPRPFNNFPYMVGYLIAVLLDDAHDRMGARFFPMYETFLLDSATLSLEELISKHFAQNISSVPFWNSALDLVMARLRSAAEASGMCIEAHPFQGLIE